MNFTKLISELKRRNVIKVATAYAIVGWLIIQIVVAIDEPLSLPPWFDTATIILVAIGFPIALIVAWAFELTPEGIKKTKEVQSSESITASTGNKLTRLIIGALVILIAFLLIERIFFAGEYGENVEDIVNVSEDSTSIKTDKSVAVLPFADFSPDKDQEWFADGLTEEILNSLVRTPDLKVAARTSSFKYKGSNEEIPAIAKALGVDHVLEGSVRRTPERLRITAQLIRASDGFHVWSETYDRTPDEAIAIQEELAISIAKALNTAMDSSALADMVKVGTASIDAYNAYLEGLNTFVITPESSERQIANLNKARTLDPSFAEAHYAAARYWSQKFSITQMGASVDEDFDEVERNFTSSIRDAIQNSNNPVDQLKYRLTLAEFNLRWQEAEKLYDEYFEQRPNDFVMMEYFIRLLIKTKRLDKANSFLKRLDEGQGGNYETRDFLVNFYHRVNNYRDSERIAIKWLKEDPTNYLLMYQVQRALLWSGKTDLARQAYNNFINYRDAAEDVDSSQVYITTLRQLCGEQNRKEAEAIFAEFKKKKFDVSTSWHVYHAMGLKKEAIELLRPLDTPETISQFSSFMWYPQFDARQYPELMKIVERENVVLPDPVDLPFALKGE